MKNEIRIGDRVHHYRYGIGVVERLVSQGLAEVKFGNSIQYVESKSLNSLDQKEREEKAKKEKARKEREEQRVATLRCQVDSLLSNGNYGEADRLYRDNCTDWWPQVNYESVKAQAIREKEAAERKRLEEEQQRAAEEEARKVARVREDLQRQVHDLLDAENYNEADRIYKLRCADWWEQAVYEADKARTQFMHQFIDRYRRGSLADLDTLFHRRANYVGLSVEDFIALKLPKVCQRLAAIGMELDEEQKRANTHPQTRLLIKARAGSGKTRTLCARAALAIRDEKLNPDQVLILAFNKPAATHVKRQVQEKGGIVDYENARTFHSLAYRLVKPKKKLLFNDGGHPSAREQSRFVQQMMQRILNPAFKETMVEFFRKELEQIENIGRDLSPKEYFVFRRALEHVTLKGDRVKSSGEKFIADFLFEHGIDYRYEWAWAWKTDFLEGATYRPDFSIVANGIDYILEHWAINPDDRNDELPKHWSVSTIEYRRQITAKRQFWQSKGVVLIETHTGMMRGGREVFENQLANLLGGNNIRCQKRPKEEILRQVFENDYAISRMAELFLQFFQRAKKRGWSADDVAQRVAGAPDKEPRARLFHELALRAYREYETMLAEQQAMDFDDLLMHATEEVKTRGASASIHLGQGRMMPIGDLRWVLLDEYQDLSELYFQMLGVVLEVNPNVRLVAVGDDWQAINAYAGAELRFFERFGDYFPGAKWVDVTTNYRSDSLVVATGNRLMEGQGEPAKASRSAFGQIEVQYPGDVWIEFRQGEQYSEQRQADSLFLRPRPDGKNPSARAFKLAQALKTCAQIICDRPDQKTMLLARAGTVYGVELKEFQTHLIQVLSTLLSVSTEDLESKISALTAHGSKGQEAHTVIILDATHRQFPKIHPDNLLFELFGVTPHTVLEEERRLFYVAMTRAEHRLFVLTDKGEESPYLEVMGSNPDATRILCQGSDRRTQALSELATKIRNKIDALGELA